MVSRRLRWDVIVAWGSSGCFLSARVEEEEEVDEEARSEVVWVAMSRWNSSVGSEAAESVSSESVDSSSSPAGLDFLRSGGIVETFCSSFAFRVRRFWWAVSARSCRAVVRVSSIGVTTYWLSP